MHMGCSNSRKSPDAPETRIGLVAARERWANDGIWPELIDAHSTSLIVHGSKTSSGELSLRVEGYVTAGLGVRRSASQAVSGTTLPHTRARTTSVGSRL